MSIALGLLAFYGGYDLLRFALEGQGMTAPRAGWLAIVGCGLGLRGARILWDDVLSRRKPGTTEADDPAAGGQAGGGNAKG